jgi:hypothetical protein
MGWGFIAAVSLVLRHGLGAKCNPENYERPAIVLRLAVFGIN